MQEFLHRKKKNPRYSIRSYARALCVDASLLCKLLSGKHLPSLKTAVSLAVKLNLDDELKKQFLESLLNERNKASYFRLFSNGK